MKVHRQPALAITFAFALWLALSPASGVLAAASPDGSISQEAKGKTQDQQTTAPPALPTPPAAVVVTTPSPTPPAAVVTTPSQTPTNEPSAAPNGVSAEVSANRTEPVNEDEQAIIPYYNNFLSNYRLGPEDVISVEVFDQPRYSKGNITVPPDGRISYYFVPDGIHVAGKTTKQIATEITKHLDEYLRDPKVTVSLERAMSARYGVLGDVAQPGIRVMSRRLSVYEALLEAGGVLATGDKKKVFVLRQRPNSILQQIPVDIAAIEKGQAANVEFLQPGDQVFVPGNRMKKVQSILSLLPVLSFARIFTGGLF